MKNYEVENWTSRSIFGTARVVEQTLTDGSHVFNVEITDGQNVVEIFALSEKHAIDCASKIRMAIGKAVGITE